MRDGKTFKRTDTLPRRLAFCTEPYILDDAGEQMATDMNLGNNRVPMLWYFWKIYAHIGTTLDAR